jgi:hypothetical protein
LPPSDNAPSFELSVEHIVPQDQLESQGLQSLRGHTWTFSLSGFIDDLKDAIRELHFPDQIDFDPDDMSM